MKSFSNLQLCIFSVALMLGGCSNPYQKFYRPNPATANSTVPLGQFSGEPEVSPGSNDPHQDVERMVEQGNAVLGSSDFVGTAQGRAGVIAEAKKIGAAKVLAKKRR